MKKLITLSTILVISGSLLAACGSTSDNTNANKSNNGNSGQSAAAPSGGDNKASGQKVTLNFWDYDSQNNTQVLDDYMKAHPNVQIIRTYIPFAEFKNKLVMGAASGDLPDIVPIDNSDNITFAQNGMLADITDLVNKWGQKDQYFEGPWSSVTYNGKVYGIPRNSNNLGIYYNVDMFKKAGIAAPPKTWDELRSDAQKLTGNGVYGFTMAGTRSEEGTFNFMPFVWQAGSDIWNLNSQGTVDALTFLRNMIKDGFISKEVVTKTQNDTATEFSSGKAAMMINGTWNLPVIEKNAKFEWAVAPLPTKVGAGTQMGGENYVITAKSKNIPAAFDFIAWAVAPEQQAKASNKGAVPPRKDVAATDFYQKDKNLKVFADQMKDAKPRGVYGSNYSKESDAIQIMFQKVYTGSAEPQQALDEAWKTIQPLAKK